MAERIEREHAIQVVRKIAERVLEKYGDLVKCVVVTGSAITGEFKPKSDIDVFLVLDDTTGKIEEENREWIQRDIEEITREISETSKTLRIDVCPFFTLTEFWNYIRMGHPMIVSFIKGGVPAYDTGFFSPIKRLLEMGKIPVTMEAIEKYLEEAPKRIMRAKTVKLLTLAEDCYYAILNMAQAALMLIGLPPQPPSKACEEFRRHFCQTGIIEPTYADWLKEIIEIRKKIEYKELVCVTGAFVDEWIEKAEIFVEKMCILADALKKRMKEKILEKICEEIFEAITIELNKMNKPPKEEEDIISVFKKEFVDTGLIDNSCLGFLKKVKSMKKDLEERRLTEPSEIEIQETLIHTRKFISALKKLNKMNKLPREL